MPEDQKSGFSEAVETGASAAHTIRGAIKTGKAISSAAKGAAAGGPYGAVAGAVWAGRKHIGKIIVAVIALLMLPVLFVLMLPGLIFGGLTNAFSPSDPEIPILNSETAIIENANEITFTLNGILGEALDGLIFGGLTNAFSPSDPEIPILNSETAIIENANEITFTLNGILGEALEDVLARIEADFAASGADHMEVKNAYSGGPIYNANLFISQYCAAKDKDFESISLNDLAATLRENKQHLYSYTSKQEIRESTVTDPETGEETTVSETWMVYTVRYNGESYFSDVVFQLTDDQKELASDYASNLSLFLGDGLLQNLEAWTGNSITALGDVTFTDGITPVVYYNQLDERYAGKAYGTDNIGGYGCGPTAMAIVVSSLTDDMVDPVEIYSYTSKQEIRESTVTDPETGEETTVSETWMVYTVRYNGESYFSDVVFQLTDDQKELASDYASNLSLFLGDGLLQNLEAWTGNSITALGDVTFTDGITPVVYYNQLDERYAGKAYGTDNIGGYGCGPTAMAIVVSSLTDDMVDPVEMAEWSYNNGYWCKSSGSYHALIPAAAGEWGLPVSGCTTAEPQRITDALANGKLVVAIMSEGHFTSSGHFIVLRGVKDGKIMVADPASYTRSEQLWDLSIILNEASRRAGAGGPFWIIG